MTRDHKSYLLIFIVIFAGFVFKRLIYDRKAQNSLKDSVIVSARVEKVEYTRGPAYVYVQYNYNGKTFHEFYDSYDRDALDSLKRYTKVRLRIPKRTPDKYIQYLGVDMQ